MRQDDGTAHEKHMGLLGLDKVKWSNTSYKPYVPPPKAKSARLVDEIKSDRDLAEVGGMIPVEPKRPVFVERGEAAAEEISKPTIGQYQVNHPDTSREAAEIIKFTAGTHKLRVFLELHRRGDYGATPDELWRATGGSFPHVSSTRCADLRKLGLAEMLETKRLTSRGFYSHVWCLTEAGHEVARSLPPELVG